MQHEPTPAPAPGHRSGRKRCPSCQANKFLSEFYVTPSGAPSGYCRTCQKAISRRSRKRRNAAIRALIALHPEYHTLLEDPERHLERDYVPEAGAVNPFLHLSLHLAVAEQLAIDQPAGVRAHFERLRGLLGEEHAALHAVLECLGETLWQAQRLKAAPDERVYLDCLERRRRG